MRRLLTILAADIAGYSKHVEENENATLQQLNALRSLMDPIIEQHGGIIANTAGDSVLAYFESPVEAVNAATKLQISHAKFNINTPSSQLLQFRLGINIGDVNVQQNGDILGHGVNVAARLEQLAEPGGICLSQNVMDQVSGKLQLEFTKIGEHRVKNLTKAISVYSVGASKFDLLKQLKKQSTKLLHNPLMQFGFTAVVGLGVLLTFWITNSGGSSSTVNHANITDFLASDPSPEEIIEFFKPSTTGYLDGRKYVILQTWGGKWDEISEISARLGGYPVAINSAEENQFVYDLTLKHPEHWQTYNGLHAGPSIGLVQKPGSSEPGDGWTWSNGEELIYENWKTFGPDNYGGKQSMARFGVEKDTRPGPTWNDVDSVQHAVVVEIPE